MGTKGNGDLSVREAGRRGGTKVRDTQPAGFYAEIGRKGGRAVTAKRGKQFFSEIGKLGGNAVKLAKGQAYFSEIGTKGGNALKEANGREYYRDMGRRGVASRWEKRGVERPLAKPVKRVGVAPNAKLSEAEVKEIRQRSRDGDWHTELANEYAVTPVTISHIVTRTTWRWVD